MPFAIAGAMMAGGLARLVTARLLPATFFLMAVLLAVVFCVYSVAIAYRHYMRMPHALAIGVFTQAIGVLGTSALLDLVYGSGAGGGILLELSRLLGL